LKVQVDGRLDVNNININLFGYIQLLGVLGHQSGFSSTSTLQPQPTQSPGTHPMSTHAELGFGYGAGGNGHGMEADMMGQMMQDPTFAQFMSSMLQNPQIIESMVATNPMLQAMLRPDMRHILQSPRFQQMVASPDALRQIAQIRTPAMMMDNDSSASSSNVGTLLENPVTAATTPVTNWAAGTILQVVPGTRFPSSLIAANAPEKRFQVQLQQLSEMGFWDPTKNMRALQVTEGDVNSAIEILCSGV
jgi:ubiquilin